MKAKTTYLLLIALWYAIGAESQQLPQYTNYKFNQFVINPALAGFRECLDINFAYRTQWVGFKGAPRTGVFAASSKIGKNTKQRNHGIGGVIETDQTTPFSRTNFNFAYAYHFRWRRDLRASFGIFAGFTQYKFDNSFLNLPDIDLDPVLNSGANRTLIIPEFTPGFWVYNSRFYFGLSVKSVTGNYMRNIGKEARLVQHIFLTSGKAYEVGSNTLMIPSAMVYYEPGSIPSVNVNLMLDYKQVVAGGVALRNGDAISALFQFKFLNHFTVGYAYDYTVSPLRLASANTHEISFNINACSGKFYSGKIPCSAYR